jgi:hypothetical protein
VEAFRSDARALCLGYTSDPMENLACQMFQIEEQLSYVAGVTDKVANLNTK